MYTPAATHRRRPNRTNMETEGAANNYFRLRRHALERRFQPAAAPREAEWRAAFPDAPPEQTSRVAALFPHTQAACFKEWLAIGSPRSGEEPISADDPQRSTLFPIADGPMWEFRKKIQRLHWVAEEIGKNFYEDKRHYAEAGEDVRAMLDAILGFFGVADELVMEGIDEMVSRLVRRKEGQYYLRAQAEQECVHSEAYSLQIQELVPADKQPRLFDAVRRDPAVGRLADWVRWWTCTEHSTPDCFLFMAFLEGVVFSGFFAGIQYFKDANNRFPSVTQLNEFIARDEALHTEFWCFLVQERVAQAPHPRVAEAVARTTVALCADFFTGSVPIPLVGINAERLVAYVHHVADTLLSRIGYTPLFGSAGNPLAFMENMFSLNSVAKSNFFEFTPTQYQNPIDFVMGFDTSPIKI